MQKNPSASCNSFFVHVLYCVFCLSCVVLSVLIFANANKMRKKRVTEEWENGQEKRKKEWAKQRETARKEEESEKTRTIGSSEIYYCSWLDVTDESVLHSYCMQFNSEISSYYFLLCLFFQWWGEFLSIHHSHSYRFFYTSIFPYRLVFVRSTLHSIGTMNGKRNHCNSKRMECSLPRGSNRQMYRYYTLPYKSFYVKSTHPNNHNNKTAKKCIRLIYFNGIIKAQLNDTAIHDYLYNYCNLGEC